MKENILMKLSDLDIELANLIAGLDQYSEADLQANQGLGVWSPAQLICHMYLAEKRSLGYVQKKLSFESQFKRVDWRHRSKMMLMKWILASRIKIRAPQGVGADSFSEDLDTKRQFEKWLDFRKEMRMYLKSLDEELFDKDVYKHPATGRQSIGQMLTFFQCHMKRHRKQLESRLPAKQ